VTLKRTSADMAWEWDDLNIPRMLQLVPVDDVLHLFDEHCGVSEEEQARRNETSHQPTSAGEACNKENNPDKADSEQQPPPPRPKSTFSTAVATKFLSKHSELVKRLRPMPLRKKSQRVVNLLVPRRKVKKASPCSEVAVKVIHLDVPKIPYISPQKIPGKSKKRVHFGPVEIIGSNGIIHQESLMKTYSKIAGQKVKDDKAVKDQKGRRKRLSAAFFERIRLDLPTVHLTEWSSTKLKKLQQSFRKQIPPPVPKRSKRRSKKTIIIPKSQPRYYLRSQQSATETPKSSTNVSY